MSATSKAIPARSSGLPAGRKTSADSSGWRQRNALTTWATTIAAIYKDRWQIELFFKALKQNLTLRSFVGTNENALKIQIWTALIALLLLKWLHYRSGQRWSLSNLAATLRLNLFTYRDLSDFLNKPWDPPPLPPPPQLRLSF